jgi:prepilin signal peptidase PulO-like enzyme (type II secretory pathway)
MLIVACAMVGLLTGSLINWAVDYLPRFAVDRANAPKTTPRFTIAWLQLRRAVSLEIMVELCMALLCAYLYARYDLSWTWLWLSSVSAFFMLVAAIDWRYRLILNILVYPAAIITIVLQLFYGSMNFSAVLIGGAFGLGIFLAAAWLRPGDLGGGDVKLAAVIGLIFGFPYALWALLIGVVGGGVAAILLIVTRRGLPKSQMPYAPFLCLGALIALLYNPLTALFRL